MLNKRFIICWLTTAMTLMAAGFFAFALVLDELFIRNAGDLIWRTHENAKVGWLLFANVVTAFAIVKIYIDYIAKKDTFESIKFGLNIGIMWGGIELINHAIFVTSVELMVSNFFGDIFLFVITAIILSKIYDACTY